MLNTEIKTTVAINPIIIHQKTKRPEIAEVVVNGVQIKQITRLKILRMLPVQKLIFQDVPPVIAPKKVEETRQRITTQIEG